MTELSTSERLDRQASAIKRLRVDRDKQAETIADLLARISFLETAMGGRLLAEVAEQDRPDEGASSSTGPSVPTEWLPTVALVETGTWVDRPECLVCGQAKGVGRKSMACATCKGQRSAAIRNEIARPVIPRCLNCGADKAAGGMQLICTACRPAARQAGY